jgi:dTDP-L-rhamnose 4-epimerase
VTGDYRLGDVRHVFASAERAAEVLGFTAAEDFDAGMAEFATARLRGA